MKIASAKPDFSMRTDQPSIRPHYATPLQNLPSKQKARQSSNKPATRHGVSILHRQRQL
jgi:hypothetical protein